MNDYSIVQQFRVLNAEILIEGSFSSRPTPASYDEALIVQVYSRRRLTSDICPAPTTSSYYPQTDLDLSINLRKATSMHSS